MSHGPEILFDEVGTFNVPLCDGAAHTQAIHPYYAPGTRTVVCRRCRGELTFTVPPIYRNPPEAEIPISRARATL